jgi:sulfoxide reductase heme-binding subunit YedZ
VHAAIGQCVHLRGRPWLYYRYGPTEHHHAFPIRHDVFGVSNYTGLLATVTIMLLFATSNDISLRALKAAKWKSLQRWNYAVPVLVAVHTFGYQLGIEKPDWRFVCLAIASIVVALTFQLLGLVRVRSAVPHSHLQG